LDDRSDTKSDLTVTKELGDLFSYAHQWALEENRNDTCTLTFSSMLAAMTAGTDPLCGWLRTHLALRGVSPDSMTKGRSFTAQPLHYTLKTTDSFRRALARAQKLCPNEHESGLSVRHFMAAYAIVPSYHLRDFLRLRIDRRAWCIELGRHLASLFPDERDAWLNYAESANPVPSFGFNTDAPEGRDLLNIDREVEAFARLIASRNTAAPLSIGVFGAWGSGKSFFLHCLRKRVESFASVGSYEGAKSKYHGPIAQIDFNAWHYSEGNLAASFVDHILRNLRIAPDDTTEILKDRGEAIIRHLDTAKQHLAIRQKAVDDAEVQLARQQQTIAEIDAKIAIEFEGKKREIARAKIELQDAQDKLAKRLADLQTQIESQAKKVSATAVGNLFIKKLASPEFSKATNAVRELMTEVKRATSTPKLILYGVIVFTIALAATALTESSIYAQGTATLMWLGSLATLAITWLKKLNAFAQSGKELEEEQERIKRTIIEEVTAAHESAISGLRTMAANQILRVEELGEQFKRIEQAPATARLALDAIEEERASALAEHAKAAAVVEQKKGELAKLTMGSLLEEFLDDRLSVDGYLKELTIFSRIRNDFGKLSDLMTKANEEYVAEKEVHGKVVGPPAVSRIVLYIDDLDRCPPERVIEVLKVVHLLLAFPLFVCVTAVDPRWITRCLRQAPGLSDIRDKTSRNGKSDLDDEVGVSPTPTDYLEKIFQIPLWLRPVPSEQRAAIVRTLLDPSESSSETRFDLPVTAPRKAIVSPLTKLQGTEGEDDTSRATRDPDIISSNELKYIDQLSGLLEGNARALKRFVNTYRLVKTALSDVEFAVFLRPLSPDGRSARYFPYQICMAQLAVLCTQRERALYLVRDIDNATGTMSLRDWLTHFETIDQDLAKRLKAALSENIEGADIYTFKLWLERTRRYSFYL
jgi:hypothetical protein